MLIAILVICFPLSSEASFHIDKLVLNFNSTCNNTTIKYFHDSKLNAAADVTIQTFVITNKMLLYITVRIAENKHDRHLKREILKTVIDVNKLFKGFYGNALIKGFMRDLADRIDGLNLKMPLPMVSYLAPALSLSIVFVSGHLWFEKHHSGHNFCSTTGEHHGLHRLSACR